MRGGSDFRWGRDPNTGEARHTMIPVYQEMLLTIVHEYPSLPDPRTLALAEIRFYYDGIRGALKDATRPRQMPRVKR